MINSEFIISIRWARDLWDKKIFVSSANKNVFEEPGGRWEIVYV